MKQRIRAAVAAGRRARSAFYRSIGLPDGQRLGPPAAETEIAAFEADIGRPLPPSYRCFLTLYDGWRMAAGALDLPTVAEMRSAAWLDRVARWRRTADDPLARRALVAGAASVTPTMLLLDPDSVDAAGEWAAIEYHHGEEARLPSFLHWLEASALEFGALAAGARGESEEEDMR